VPSHGVRELVLAKVPHLSDTTLRFNRETATTKAFHTGTDQSADDSSFQFGLVGSKGLKYRARILYVS